MYSLHTNCPSGCDQPINQPPGAGTPKIRLLWTALALIGGFSAIELAVSISSHSLALLAEAGHMLSDCVALALALLATWIAALPASPQAPFGYRRVEILAALANGVGLVAIALWVAWEAITRLQTPADDVLGMPMLVTAAIGLGVNSLNAFLLHDHTHNDLNLRGAFLHMVADAVSSVGVLIAAIAVFIFHWNWADGGISLFVAALIFAGGIPLIRQSIDILLEKTPNTIDLSQVQTRLETLEGVLSIQQLRVWAIAPGHEVLSAHLIVKTDDGKLRDRVLKQAQDILHDGFGIQDSVLQIMALALPETINLNIPPQMDWLTLGKGITGE